MTKPILCLDFDGVIHSYTSGWAGIDTIPDLPVPGAFDFIDKASEFFQVQIYSSRSKTEAGRQAMFKWMIKHEGPINSVTFCHEKPAAFLTIDDRAICFTGAWPEAASLLAFKPWNKL